MDKINIPESMLDEPINIAQYVAPHIIGERNDLAKEVVGLQALMNIRHEKFHVSLVGNIGSGKSDLASFIKDNHYSAARTGKDTNKAGLIGERTFDGLKGGVLRSSAGRLVVFDELDKAPASIKFTLLEAMEERRVTASSRGNTYTCDAYVNIIATMNPRGGSWYGEPSLGDIPLPAAVMSRFHMFVPFFSLESDRYEEVGEKLHLRDDMEALGAPLRELIDRARAIPDISITPAQNKLVGRYVGQMKDSNDMFSPFITPRYLISYVSLAKTYARLYGRSRVADEDIELVRGLYDRMFQAWTNY